ncbi:MAG TPA: GspH/FimT family pseudopilin [Vicinamibacterales bacterium]
MNQCVIRAKMVAGLTLVELMLALGLILVLAGMALPQVLSGLDSSRAHAAARYLAARMALARSQAVARSSTVALRFSGEAATLSFAAYVDGNHNGVRSNDIESGADTRLDAPARPSDLFPGVAISSSFGSSGIVSFTPAGTATSGTVYIRGRDGSRYAVRVLGATGRTRVLRYDAARREFIEIP